MAQADGRGGFFPCFLGLAARFSSFFLFSIKTSIEKINIIKVIILKEVKRGITPDSLFSSGNVINYGNFV